MTEIVQKGWGHEEIFSDTTEYCGKLLHFHRGGRCSMHYHAKKHETWRVLNGSFIVEYIDTRTAEWKAAPLKEGDVWTNPPNSPHRLTCLAAGVILEVSTEDRTEDNYRVEAGDSQR